MVFLSLFTVQKPIIGMIHLGCFPGHKDFKGKEFVIERALKDLHILQESGVDGVILENWEDQTYGPFVSEEDKLFFEEVAGSISRKAHLPIGVNVLPNDYKSAFSIAQRIHAGFIQLDVLTDKVRTNYLHSKADDFQIDVNLEELAKIRDQHPDIALIASVQPKHYIMLEDKTIETSAQEALAFGVDALVITGDFTGMSPDLREISAVKRISSKPVLIGSGLNLQNCEVLLSACDGAIVGTSIKSDDFSEVVEEKVRRLLYAAGR